MGVPGLFSNLLRNYPVAFASDQDQSALALDNIYLDGNAILYPIAEVTKVPEEIAKSLLQVSQQYSDKYGCSCSIYMDGPAHMGKIRQQRMRRFLYDPSVTIYTQVTDIGERKGEVSIPSVARSQMLGVDVPTIIEWSPSMFTPGTEMMERIHLYIEEHLGEYPGINIYSSSYESGEGEHKIMQHIRDVSLRREQPSIYRVGIVGKDADLLLLAMSVTVGEGWSVQPYIIRHNDRLADGGVPNGYTPDHPIYTVDCSLLRENVLESFQHDSVGGRTMSIWDFIIATFVVGNDFFPAIPETKNIHDVLPLIFSISPHLYDAQNISIYWTGLKEFIYTLASTIDMNPSIRGAAYIDWLQLPSVGRDERENKIRSAGEISLESFKSLYYFHMSPFSVNTDGMVLSWLTTVQWIFLYYHQGMESASIAWQYPLHYSPTLSTLVSSPLFNDMHMGETRVTMLSTKRVPPVTPTQALAAVLPVWLHNLLPRETREKLRKIPQYYPYAFQVLKHSGDPIIPVIPYDVVSSL